MKNLNKKQKIILTLLGIGIIALVALGITYAYFLAVVEPGEKAPVDIITDTTDNLLFDVEDNINLAINKYNFGVGGDNLTSHAKATATLRANSTDNTATYNYYLYFNIESNEFVYTTEDHKPEIILTITDPEGNPITSVEGLTYVTSGSVSGFDITTASGLFTIAGNYEITSNSSTTDTVQEWNFTATFINLDSDQNDNTGKNMSGKITIRKEELNNLFASYIKNQYTDGTNGLYFHNSELENGAEDNSYRYFGDNPNNYVCFGSDQTVCPYNNLYRIIGVFDGNVKLIKADFVNDDLLGNDGDFDRRLTISEWGYEGVYVGKNTEINSYRWDETTKGNFNKFDIALVNLNINFLNNIGEKWASLIADKNWFVGSATDSELLSPTIKETFDYEVGEKANKNEVYFAKIGLMYISDYAFSFISDYWLDAAYNLDDSSWMYLGIPERTISHPKDDESTDAYLVLDGGAVDYDSTFYWSVRPVFYLDSLVSYVSGDGTMENPYRIGV